MVLVEQPKVEWLTHEAPWQDPVNLCDLHGIVVHQIGIQSVRVLSIFDFVCCPPFGTRPLGLKKCVGHAADYLHAALRADHCKPDQCWSVLGTE